MKVYVITTRAFKNDEYFHGLEETAVKYTQEEALDEFHRQFDELGDYFWHYGPQYAEEDDIDNDGMFITCRFMDTDGNIAFLTLREIEQ